MYAIGTFKAWAATRAARNGGEVNHSIHAVLTIASLGLWLPVWTVICVKSRAKMRSTLVDLRHIERLEISPEYRRQLARMS
ncbi:hypothetical protein [Maridesulfovibrio hydrothermalis]|uniref:Uncharacterized protein n=1 Tax=Maridesulfovibrio hydrothermalis AM13 = DSM 14728 TaxID=1121451 RepID=L0R8A5_9BACT|nr:hypothetical protein [Maridesulfovibrio hydrothermalis]CCO22993.1 conserved protein of unknown function [Maridesulfovibrio hydrothermalis AM13 = DSM 14728]